MSKYIVYYKEHCKFTYYDGVQIKIGEIYNLKINFFEMYASYSNTNESLKLYYDNIKIWSEQIRLKLNLSNFDYLSKYKDTTAISLFFLLFCKKKIANHDNISFNEQNG